MQSLILTGILVGRYASNHLTARQNYTHQEIQRFIIHPFTTVVQVFPRQTQMSGNIVGILWEYEWETKKPT